MSENTRCSICDNDNFVDYTACNCGKVLICGTCSDSYSNNCLSKGIPMGCFICSREFLYDNMSTNDLREEYAAKLIKKLFSKKYRDTLSYRFPVPKICRAAVNDMTVDMAEVIEKELPKGVKLALTILHGKELKKIIKSRNEESKDMIENVVKAIKVRCCAGTFCGGKLQKNGDYMTCMTCTVNFCKQCGYECFEDHECDIDRINKVPIGIYKCVKCEKFQEYFFGDEIVSCSCEQEYRVSSDIASKKPVITEFRFSDELDEGNIKTKLIEFEDRISKIKPTFFTDDVTYDAKKDTPLSVFEIYSFWKMNMIELHDYVLKIMSLIAKVSVDENAEEDEAPLLTTKVIKKYTTPTVYPNFEALNEEMNSKLASAIEAFEEEKEEADREREKKKKEAKAVIDSDLEEDTKKKPKKQIYVEDSDNQSVEDTKKKKKKVVGKTTAAEAKRYRSLSEDSI